MVHIIRHEMMSLKKYREHICLRMTGVRKARWCFVIGSVLLLAGGCRSSRESRGPRVIFGHVPPAKAGGRELLGLLSGHVEGAPAGSRIVAYAHNDSWWVQPFRARPITVIGRDGGWSTSSHLGTDYAVLVVSSDYQPPDRVAELPAVGDKVLAVAVTQGSSGQMDASKILHFSGYDWTVSSSTDYRGGDLNEYEPSNAWVDDHGYLHLLMEQQGGQWKCAGIRLTRSLGYGTYRFVLQERPNLPPSATLAIFTRDDGQDQEDAAEMDIELSRWGKLLNRNTDYVVQPYYVPENTVHFNVSSGTLTHVLRWEPGIATFRTFAGYSVLSPRYQVMEHTFRSGVPVPAAERVHLDLYDFHHSTSGLQHPVEIVVESFEYLP